MKAIFTKHALVRMKERNISRKIVLNAINNPDKVETSSVLESRFLLKKVFFNEEMKRDYLLLIIGEEKKSLVIVTVIATSKISKYF